MLALVSSPTADFELDLEEGELPPRLPRVFVTFLINLFCFSTFCSKAIIVCWFFSVSSLKGHYLFINLFNKFLNFSSLSCEL